MPPGVAIEGWLSKHSSWRSGSRKRLFYRLFYDGSLLAYDKIPRTSNGNKVKEKDFIGLSPAAQVASPKNLPDATSFCILVPKEASGSTNFGGPSITFASTGDFEADDPGLKGQWVVALHTVIASLTAELVDVSESSRIARNLQKRIASNPCGITLVPPPSVMTDDTNSFGGGATVPSGNLLHQGTVSIRLTDANQSRKANWYARSLELYDSGELQIHTKSPKDRAHGGNKCDSVLLLGTEEVYVRTHEFVPYYAFDVKILDSSLSPAKTYQIRTGDMKELRLWVRSFHFVLEAAAQDRTKKSQEGKPESREAAAAAAVAAAEECLPPPPPPPPPPRVAASGEPDTGYLVEDLGSVPVPRQTEDPSVAGVAVLTWNMNERLPSQEDMEAVLGKLLYSKKRAASLEVPPEDGPAGRGGAEHALPEGNSAAAARAPADDAPAEEGRAGDALEAPGDSAAFEPNRIVVVSTQECRPISVTAISFNFQVGTWNKRCTEFFKSKGLYPVKQENLAATTISVFVHGSIFHKISSVEVSLVPCGLGGVLLNKGAVGIALQVFQTRMCFISSHLAAHQHKVLKRHADYYRVTGELFHGGNYEDGRKPLAVSASLDSGEMADGAKDQQEDEEDDDEEGEDGDDDHFALEFPGLADLALTSKGRRSLSGTQRSLFLPPARGHNEATLRRLGLRREAGEISLEEYARGAQQLVHESMHKLVEDGLMDVVEYNAIIAVSLSTDAPLVDPDADEGGDEGYSTKKGKDSVLSDEEEILPALYNPPPNMNYLRLVDLFDCVFFSGDMNYRIDSTKDKVEEQLLRRFQVRRKGSVLATEFHVDSSGSEDPELRWLTDRDQLNKARRAGHVFHGFEEGALCFKPTFKFDKDSDAYDTSAKQRVPSWCDRVLYKPGRSELTSYDTVGDARHSDHRPVIALFDVALE